MGPTRTTQDPGATVLRSRTPAGAAPPSTAPGRGRIVGALRRAALPLAAVLACGVAASLAAALGIRGLGRAVLSVPNDFKPLLVPDIFPYAFAPIVGCSVAFVVAFIVKKPGAHSMHFFVAAGSKFAVLDGGVALLNLPGSANVGSIVTLLAVILCPLLIMPALLRFVPRPGSSQIRTLPAV